MQFREHGMPEIPGHLLRTDGKKVCYGPKKKAWFRLHEFTTRSGKVVVNGVFGYKDVYWKVEDDGSFTAMTPEEREAARLEWARKEREQQARVEQARRWAANRARQQWDNAARQGESAYLARKRVARAESLRYMADGAVILPLIRYDEGRLVGSQKISPDGSKRFNRGMEKTGAACRLGEEPLDGELILLAEGYATAASGREAVDYQHPVYMALDSGNLKPVAEILRVKYPASPLLLLADDDYMPKKTGEPNGVGESKARAAAQTVGNAAIVLPVFSAPRRVDREDESLPVLTDFNDLHCVEGIEPVRQQLAAAIAGLVSPAPSSVAEMADGEAVAAAAQPAQEQEGSGDVAAVFARMLLRHFALVEGKTRVIDKRSFTEYTLPALRARFGADTVTDWLARDDKLLLTQAEVSAAKRRREEMEKQADPESIQMLDRYIYLDGSTNIWDRQLKEVIPAAAAKLAMGSGYDDWLDSPARRVIPMSHVRFAPGLSLDPERYINLFTGMEMEPAWPRDRESLGRGLEELMMQFPACEGILQLAQHLCDYRLEVFEWLMNWLAYPLQHVGTKMDTAVLMHGSVHGTGKSMFFEVVMKQLYGRYGITLGQDQLESQYTGSRSAKLFLLFEEVISSKQRYSQTGKLKHMITGLTQVIEKKFMNAWEESNHANCVFLSNAIQPLHIEAYDRRFQVIWPLLQAEPELYSKVNYEVANGGLEQFLAFLLALPLTLTVEACQARDVEDGRCAPDCPTCHGMGAVRRAEAVKFDPHTKPLMTEEKARVIRYGLNGWELFAYEWRRGELPVPFVSCITEDLYRVYRRWCESSGETSHILSLNKFSLNVSVNFPGEMSKKSRAHWRWHGQVGQNTVFKVGREDGVAEQDYLGKHIATFRDAAASMGLQFNDGSL
ncbi:hypothetical protein BUE93_21390 [Chromobacterium amazonense]|uniref:NrS-1 polymerase-like helicase domain-containing protein n=1 Tax=Chromobacterium amazonense TaxID=1382803 RepID=A0A2S9WYQ8_9NEIS|nr:DUF5906 domain-containing protein [Chromobacterium amazonense]PRP68598.1 hypothetical protein BUE93_21390 [Chromobacterium amazonense]